MFIDFLLQPALHQLIHWIENQHLLFPLKKLAPHLDILIFFNFFI